MTYINTGGISCREKNLAEVANLINEMTRLSVDADDAYENNGKMTFDIEDEYGDLEKELSELCEKCQDREIWIELNISYYGDAEGQYICENGKFTALSEEEMHLRNVDDEDLIAEIYRRGLAQKIHDDVVRAFMAGELQESFGFDTGAAKEASDVAYDYYANTEGATQYDGIEYAAEHCKK